MCFAHNKAGEDARKKKKHFNPSWKGEKQKNTSKIKIFLSSAYAQGSKSTHPQQKIKKNNNPLPYSVD